MGRKKHDGLTPAELKMVTKEVDQFGLTPQQRKFALNYLKTGNVRQSALAAELSPRHCYRLLAHKNVVAFMKSFRDDVLGEETMNAQETLLLLADIARGDAEDTFITQSGKQVSYPVSVQNRLKALEILSKHHKIIGADTAQMNLNIIVDVESYDDEGDDDIIDITPE